MTLEELIQSIHMLEAALQRFEDRYRIRSEDFYQLAQRGELEQSMEFIEWLGLYEIKLKRERKYHELVTQLLQQARTTSGIRVSLPIREPA
jgi:hypothetical protein